MNYPSWNTVNVTARARVFIDNDFGGDPDGLVQLAHHLLSPSVEVVGIISSHLRADDGWNELNETADSVFEGVKLAEQTIALCGQSGKHQVFEGSKDPLANTLEPQPSQALQALIAEAEKNDDRPLYFACGGSLTQAASLFLARPDLTEKITLVWIGGMEHEGHAQLPPDIGEFEYNFAEDPISVQVVFNSSNYKFWQIPRNAYRQTLISRAELELKLQPAGELGAYLFDALSKVHAVESSRGTHIGETYVMGDSPLVLLTALQSSFEADPSSSHYVQIERPSIDAKGRYGASRGKGTMRVYTLLDVRLMFEDFFAKLSLLNR